MIQKILNEQFDTLLDAPESIPKMREMILQLAVMGKLVPQDPNDEPASELLFRAGISASNGKPTESMQPGWMCITLEPLIQLVSGQHILHTDYNDHGVGIPYLTGPADFGDRFPIVTKWTERPKAVAVADDVLVTVKGAGLGKLNIVNVQTLAISRQLMAVRSQFLEKMFLFYLLKSHYNHFQASGVGIAIPGLSRSDLLELDVRLPPLAEQKRIVEKVDRLMAFLDELEARQKERDRVQVAFSGAALSKLTEVQEPPQFAINLNRVKGHFDLIVKTPADVKKVRETILQLAVMGKLVPQDANDEPASELLKRIAKEKETLIAEGKIKRPKELPPVGDEEKPFALPPGWEWVRFDFIADIETNLIAPVGKYRLFPHIAPNHIEKDTGKLLEYSTVADDDVRSGKHLFQAGRILYSKIRPNLNKVVIVDFPGLCSADMYPVFTRIVPKFLHRLMLSNIFLSQVVREDNRIAMPKVNQEQLSVVQLPLPPLAEQKRIVEKVDRLMTLCDELEAKLTKSREEGARLLEAVVSRIAGGVSQL